MVIKIAYVYHLVEPQPSQVVTQLSQGIPPSMSGINNSDTAVYKNDMFVNNVGSNYYFVDGKYS